MLIHATTALREAGAAQEAITPITALVQELAEESEHLADAIFNHERNHCEHCHYGYTSTMRVPYGDQAVDINAIECATNDPMDCPIVKACGYYGMPELPPYLRRQAE